MEQQRRIPVLRAHDPENYSSFDEWLDCQKAADRADDFKLVAYVLIGVALAAAAIFCGYMFIDSWSATGPGCPGDPSWLGHCSEVDGS